MAGKKIVNNFFDFCSASFSGKAEQISVVSIY